MYNYTINDLKYALKIVDKEFYIDNFARGYEIEYQALKNLAEHYDLHQIFGIVNFNMPGIVEYVANNKFYLEELENCYFIMKTED